MTVGWAVIPSALLYLCVLFVVARHGDGRGRHWLHGRSRATIYALGLSVYCTSWTFYGSVDFAALNGFSFICEMSRPRFASDRARESFTSELGERFAW